MAFLEENKFKFSYECHNYPKCFIINQFCFHTPQCLPHFSWIVFALFSYLYGRKATDRLRLLLQSCTPHSDMLIQISITIILSPQPRKLHKVGLFPPWGVQHNLFGGYLTNNIRREARTHIWSGLWPISWYVHLLRESHN